MFLFFRIPQIQLGPIDTQLPLQGAVGATRHASRQLAVPPESVHRQRSAGVRRSAADQPHAARVQTRGVTLSSAAAAAAFGERRTPTPQRSRDSRWPRRWRDDYTSVERSSRRAEEHRHRAHVLVSRCPQRARLVGYLLPSRTRIPSTGPRWVGGS